MSIVIGNKTISSIQIGNKTVERIEIGGKTAYELPDYLCFTDVSGSSNTLTLTKNGNAPTVSLEYSTDKVNWTTWTENNGVRTYIIPANGKVYLRGDNTAFGYSQNNTDYHNFSSTGNVNTSGDLMTIIDKTGQTKTIETAAFKLLFINWTTLITAPSISATTVGENGMNNMFYGCSNLVSTPSMTISSINGGGACNNMFNGCSSLTDTSGLKLNATSLPNGAYKQMFRGCSNLVTPPEIMATSLSDGSGNTQNGSLAYMFYGCSKLNTIKVHFTSWNSGNCTRDWTYGTKSSGTFYKPSSLPSTKNTSGNTSNPHYIPYNWTVTNI